MQKYHGAANDYDQATGVAVDDNGNVYVTGFSSGNGTGYDFATIRYSDDGDLKWVKRYNSPGNGNDQASAIAVDDHGNVYVTGISNNATYEFITTIKYDADGDTKWVEKYKVPAGDFLGQAQVNAIAVDKKGNVPSFLFFYNDHTFCSNKLL